MWYISMWYLPTNVLDTATSVGLSWFSSLNMPVARVAILCTCKHMIMEVSGQAFITVCFEQHSLSQAVLTVAEALLTIPQAVSTW